MQKKKNTGRNANRGGKAIDHQKRKKKGEKKLPCKKRESLEETMRSGVGSRKKKKNRDKAFSLKPKEEKGASRNAKRGRQKNKGTAWGELSLVKKGQGGGRTGVLKKKRGSGESCPFQKKEIRGGGGCEVKRFLKDKKKEGR